MSEFHIEATKRMSEKLMDNGFEFLEASRRCAGTDENGTIHILDGDKPTMIPVSTVVNAAFACEMFLKALIKNDGKEYPTGKNGHDLAVLYDKLSPDTKNEINRFMGYSKSTGQPIFEEFTKLHPNDFTDIRYYIEKPGWHDLSPLIFCGNAYNLGQITRIIIEQNN